jgi:uridine kinase
MKDGDSFKKLMLKHYQLHPKMQLQDMVKLIYQNEFAGGHLITNENDSLMRLTEEYQGLNKNSRNRIIPAAFEEIGSGLCRVNLAALHSTEIDITTVNRFFINTANSVCGSIKSFEEKLDVLKECCKDRSLPYGFGELEAYLDDYQRQGYPPVSHSKNYQTAYSPAYRIVKTEYMYYFKIFQKIDSLMKSNDSIQIAIDGNSCAGKSTLAALIGNVYDCNVFHMDNFFLRPELKTKERLKEIGGNVDYVRFQKEVVCGLQSGHEFEYQIYNCKKMLLDQYISVMPKKLSIIEGVYSMHPVLFDNYNLKVFLYIDKKQQMDRILKRDGANMLEKFLSQWIPLEDEYFEKMKIKEKSDLVFKG